MKVPVEAACGIALDLAEANPVTGVLTCFSTLNAVDAAADLERNCLAQFERCLSAALW